MTKMFDLLFGLARIPLDFLMIMSAWIVAYFLRPITDLIPGIQSFFPAESLPLFNDFILFALITTCVLVLFFSFENLYSFQEYSTKRSPETLRIITTIGIWGMAIITFFAIVYHKLFFSRVLLAQAMVFSILFVIFGRFLLHIIQIFFLKIGKGKKRILLIGSTPFTSQLANCLDQKPAFELAGILTNDEKQLQNSFVVGTIKTIETSAYEHVADEIWLCEPSEKEKEILDFCQRSHIGYRWIPDVRDAQVAHIHAIEFDGIPVLQVQPTSIEGWGKVCKRLFDFILSLFGILFLIPFFLLIGILIKIDSDGPIFYRSSRIGREGTPLSMWKFRSMVAEADTLKQKISQQNHRTDSPLFKVKNDPRVTRFGQFLRRWSIDELPQLFNVFTGEMSLVGPRAHLPEEVAKYEPHQRRVLAIKPGITGFAQIHGRSDLLFKEEIRLDLFYIANWSFWFDIKILFLTFFIVMKGEGAD